MVIKYILFDLDGTLLPMDQDVFIREYYGGLMKKVVPLGFDAQDMLKGVNEGVRAMVLNDGSRTNEEVFWEKFAGILGAEIIQHKSVFEEFYRNEFQLVAEHCGKNPKAKEAVETLKAKGYRVALATNPLFPTIATESRIRWTGLLPEDFELYTTYEDMRYCKPNIKYYEQVLEKVGVKAEECLMVGNDVDEDMIVKELGMQVFLITDCIINKHNKDISEYPHGSFDDLLKYVEEINN